jgi:hypothetical protein
MVLSSWNGLGRLGNERVSVPLMRYVFDARFAISTGRSSDLREEGGQQWPALIVRRSARCVGAAPQ